MQNFFYDDKFYKDLESFIERENLTGIICQLDDNQTWECMGTQLENYAHIDADFIVDAIDEERKTEDGDELIDIKELLNKYCDFDKINAAMPKAYYPSESEFTITKADLVDFLKQSPTS